MGALGLPDFIEGFLLNRGGGEAVDSLSARKAITALIAAGERHQNIRSIVQEIVVKTPYKYAHTNSKGVTYYLFETNIRFKNSDEDQTACFFAGNFWPLQGRMLADLPESKEVMENPRERFSRSQHQEVTPIGGAPQH